MCNIEASHSIQVNFSASKKREEQALRIAFKFYRRLELKSLKEKRSFVPDKKFVA